MLSVSMNCLPAAPVASDVATMLASVMHLPPHLRMIEVGDLVEDAEGSQDSTPLVYAMLGEAEHRHLKDRRRIKFNKPRRECREVGLTRWSNPRPSSKKKKLMIEALRLADQLELAYSFI